MTVCVAIYCYVYKDHRDIATESADFSTTIPNLQNEFIANDSIANLKYQDKTIQITGNLTSVDIESKAIVVDGKVYASFLKIVPTNLTVGKSIKISSEINDQIDNLLVLAKEKFNKE